jgi:hypothetical protein
MRWMIIPLIVSGIDVAVIILSWSYEIWAIFETNLDLLKASELSSVMNIVTYCPLGCWGIPVVTATY